MKSQGRIPSAFPDDKSLGAKDRCSTPPQVVPRKSATDSKRPQQPGLDVFASREQVTPPSLERGVGTVENKASSPGTPSVLCTNPQSMYATKRGHSSLEALVRKVPVPKLPGATGTSKMPVSDQEKSVPPLSQPVEKSGGQALSINDAEGDHACPHN